MKQTNILANKLKNKLNVGFTLRSVYSYEIITNISFIFKGSKLEQIKKFFIQL